jgi:hypothetical protein
VKKCDTGGRVERVEGRAVYGTARLAHGLYLRGSTQSNTRGVERHHGTSRLRNQRQVRKTWAFSQAPRSHRWMSWLSVGRYNFCRPHSSLKIKETTQVRHRSPALAAGVTDPLWSTREWLLTPVLGRQRSSQDISATRGRIGQVSESGGPDTRPSGHRTLVSIRPGRHG